MTDYNALWVNQQGQLVTDVKKNERDHHLRKGGLSALIGLVSMSLFRIVIIAIGGDYPMNVWENALFGTCFAIMLYMAWLFWTAVTLERNVVNVFLVNTNTNTFAYLGRYDAEQNLPLTSQTNRVIRLKTPFGYQYMIDATAIVLESSTLPTMMVFRGEVKEDHQTITIAKTLISDPASSFLAVV